LEVIGPDDPKFTVVADTEQFASTVAVQVVVPPVAVLPPVGQAADP
jgi:hypothetical protein